MLTGACKMENLIVDEGILCIVFVLASLGMRKSEHITMCIPLSILVFGDMHRQLFGRSTHIPEYKSTNINQLFGYNYPQTIQLWPCAFHGPILLFCCSQWRIFLRI